MDSIPRCVFVSFYKDGPGAGPISIGMFGTAQGNLLPVFSSRQKAISFAITTLGAPPSNEEEWDGVELSAGDLLQILLEDRSITHVAPDPPLSGDVEMVPARECVERLSREIEDPEKIQGDFRKSLVRLFVYGDVS